MTLWKTETELSPNLLSSGGGCVGSCGYVFYGAGLTEHRAGTELGGGGQLCTRKQTLKTWNPEKLQVCSVPMLLKNSVIFS